MDSFGQSLLRKVEMADTTAMLGSSLRSGYSLLQSMDLAQEDEAVYTRDVALPEGLGKKIDVKFVAQPGSIAGGLYGLRLLR